MDFRNWLISMGRNVFEAALTDPETLVAAAAAPGVEVCAFEEFSGVARGVLEGRGIPDSARVPVKQRRRPSGKRFKHDTLPQRFPRLWAAFGSR